VLPAKSKSVRQTFIQIIYFTKKKRGKFVTSSGTSSPLLLPFDPLCITDARKADSR